MLSLDKHSPSRDKCHIVQMKQAREASIADDNTTKVRKYARTACICIRRMFGEGERF